MKASQNIYPIFPLELFGLPGEEFKLHIIEDRYIQLVNDTMKGDHCFLIPFTIKDQRQGYGSFVKITELIQNNENNDEIDISFSVEGIFRMEQIFEDLSGKMYKKAQVQFLEFRNKLPDLKLLSLYNEFVGLQGKHRQIIISQASIDLFKLVDNLNLPIRQKYSFISGGSTIALENNIINYLTLQNEIERSLKRVGLKFVMN